MRSRRASTRPSAFRRILAGILLPRPDELHGRLHGFGDGDGRRDLIVRVAAPEATADERVVDINLLRLQAGEARCGVECVVRVLRPYPYVEPVGPQKPADSAC
jgi:hypothetical protein